LCTQSDSSTTRASRAGIRASSRAATCSGNATLVSPRAGMRSIDSTSACDEIRCPRWQSTAASAPNAITATLSRDSSAASAPTVAAAVRTRSPRIEPDTSTSSTSERTDEIRSRTTMSSSSTTARPAILATVASRSMSSAPPRNGTLASTPPAPRRAAVSRRGRRSASRAAISRARRSVSGSAAVAALPVRGFKVPCSWVNPVPASASRPGWFLSQPARGGRGDGVPPCGGSPGGRPPGEGTASSSTGSSVSVLGLRRSGLSPRAGSRLGFCLPGRLMGESASIALQPGDAAAGSRMK
jgi:hypothetical protein